MRRVVSITLGRPIAIHLEAIDVELPSVDNDHLVNSQMPPWAALSINRTSMFVHIVNYRLICGRIMGALHGPRKANQVEMSIGDIRDNLVVELDEWRRNMPDLSQLETGTSADICRRR